VKTSQLHLARDRRERFAALASKVWLESSLLRTWVIAEPALIVSLLRDPRAVILSIDEMVGMIERTYGTEFANVKFAARHLPLFLEGDIHAERRRRFTRYLSGRLAELEIGLPGLLERHLEPFRGEGRIELVAEVTGPLVRDINAILVGRPLADAIASLDLLDLFALNKSVTRFKDLDRRVGQAIEFLHADSEDEELLGERFTALAMGLETLMTMLTEGLFSAFREEPGVSGGDATLPAYPIETGVPISYRRAEADFEMSGHEFKQGDLLRLQLQTLGYVPGETDRKWIFGAGAHSCVGKQASLRIWAELKRVFDAMHIRGQVRSYELAPSHYLVRHKFIHIEVFR
jgi:cytochrome P450